MTKELKRVRVKKTAKSGDKMQTDRFRRAALPTPTCTFPPFHWTISPRHVTCYEVYCDVTTIELD